LIAQHDMDPIKNPPPLPGRPREGHKGLFGRVLVVGGQVEMIGAPVLAATAALRMGAGLVQIAVPRAILPACLTITPELIGLGLGGSSRELVAAAERADALVVGPGIGRSREAVGRVQRLIRLDKPIVIDADALNIIAGMKKWPTQFKASAVLTPHPGEMARLGKLFGRANVPKDDRGRVDVAIAAAKAFKQIVVLKGDRSVVTDGRQVYVNSTGDSSLSKAGSGDVLCGLLATLLAQTMEPFDAACAGVYVHGRAGELAGQKLGRRCVLARDVIDALPGAIAEYERIKPARR
jgi:NAD(P)H-hydrate epimerase